MTHASARQVRDVVRRAERRDAARVAELVRAGIVIPPTRPKSPAPTERLVVEGGLSADVIRARR